VLRLKAFTDLYFFFFPLAGGFGSLTPSVSKWFQGDVSLSLLRHKSRIETARLVARNLVSFANLIDQGRKCKVVICGFAIGRE
jgi:hypothetical protein